jgi:predicted ATP-grasp superfamily ATP-dependent carboligase
MYKILVPDAETRKAFDIISILKYSFPNIPIICGNKDGTKSTNRYIKRIFNCTSVSLRTGNNEQCVLDFKAISDQFGNDHIIFVPTEEDTVAFFYNFLGKYGPRNYIYILPTEECYITARDKNALNLYCLAHNLNAPVRYEISEISSLRQDQFPILLKPCIGSGSIGQYRLYKPSDFTVTIQNEVMQKPYLAQELLANGHDVQGAFYLYKDGQLIESYSHQRIRTSPPSGGVTVLSKLFINEQLIKQGKEILDALKWNGLVMLEFLYDEKAKVYKVIEANPRIWGSIMLSEYCGYNLLTNYVRMCMNQSIVSNHRSGESYIRWLFPVDILNYIRKLGRISNFWHFKDTCYINWSYAERKSALLFNITNIFNKKNIKRFFRH